LENLQNLSMSSTPTRPVADHGPRAHHRHHASLTGLPRLRLWAVMVFIAALVGCSSTTAGVAVPAASPTASTVNPSVLDPGRYPTAPAPPLGTAGSEQAGRLAEGRRMAGYVVGPWQADPALIARLPNDTAVLDNEDQVGTTLVWPAIAAGAWSFPFVVGFMSERRTSGPASAMSLRNAVLRYPDPIFASAAAQGMFARATAMPRDPTVTPIVTEPERAVPIAGHSDAKATLLTFQENAQTARELTVLTAHGPYVLVQV
jgi:hypothetical protein